ncbi:hypothetical protein [Flammeovirga agarivorans]|uniref:Uncharacterized protein n=1 Tax=Flammeovirga agarivorans TaxID=2726742 RepID=A0A7X8XYP8_9BACT|nr:hypothetical protein [Flammeovirga agarivorans]NLR94427.1 hypothetical protein [Flammeovirga agarivorans]
MKYFMVIVLLSFVSIDSFCLSYGFERPINFNNPEEVYYYNFWKELAEGENQYISIEGLFDLHHNRKVDHKEREFEELTFLIPVLRNNNEPYPEFSTTFFNRKTQRIDITYNSQLQGTGEPYWMKVEIINFNLNESNTLLGIEINETVFDLQQTFIVKKIQDYTSLNIDYIKSWEKERKAKQALPPFIQFLFYNMLETDKDYVLSFIYCTEWELKPTEEDITWYKRSFSLSDHFKVISRQEKSDHFYFVQMKVPKHRVPDLQMIYLADRTIEL